MPKIYISDESPLDMAAVQAHSVANENWPDQWETRTLEKIVERIGESLRKSSQNIVVVQIPEGLYNDAVNALSSLEEERDIEEFQRETFTVTKGLLEQSASA